MKEEKDIEQQGKTQVVAQGGNANEKDSRKENISSNEIVKIIKDNDEEKMTMGIKVVIGLASAVILFLIIFIAYQYGQNKTTEDDKQDSEIQTMNNNKTNDKVGLIGNNSLGDNSNDDTRSGDNSSTNTEENTNVNVQNTTLSEDTVNKLEDDLNGVSNDDDEFQDVKIILDENIN